MRVATYNVHDCVGRDSVYDPLRIISVIQELNADIIALQELTLDDAGEIMQLIREHTAMFSVDGTLFTRGIGRYGNVLLSRRPFVMQSVHELPERSRELRGVIHAEIEWNHQTIAVFATHLGLNRGERRQQIEFLTELCKESGPPAILMGDLNVWRGAGELRPLADIGFFHYSVRSFPIWPRPVISLDRIMVQQPVMIESCVRHEAGKVRQASDHYPLVAQISLLKD